MSIVPLPRGPHISELGMNEETEKPSAEKSDDMRTANPRRRVKVTDILSDQREAIIEHNGQDYLLRITANGRLILTK